MVKQHALLMTTYLASITVISLLTGTTGIVKKRMYLDRWEEMKQNTWRKNVMNYSNKNNCRFIYPRNIILFLQTYAFTKKFVFALNIILSTQSNLIIL